MACDPERQEGGRQRGGDQGSLDRFKLGEDRLFWGVRWTLAGDSDNDCLHRSNKGHQRGSRRHRHIASSRDAWGGKGVSHGHVTPQD
jgi:hypothetical protein